MFFKILKQAMADTVEEVVDDIKSTAEHVKDNIVPIIAVVFGFASVLFIVAMLATVIKYFLGANAISYLVFMCSGTIIVVPYISFLIRFYVNFNERTERFLKDKEETFRRLSE